MRVDLPAVDLPAVDLPAVDLPAVDLPAVRGPGGGRPGGGGPQHGTHGNPLTMELSTEQKDTLREIHKKYGTFPGSPLMFDIKTGDQVIDLKLK